jgi:hypothetical protein
MLAPLCIKKIKKMEIKENICTMLFIFISLSLSLSLSLLLYSNYKCKILDTEEIVGFEIEFLLVNGKFSTRVASLIIILMSRIHSCNV